ncbi:hypothetical protein SAMD00019534_042430 [Acytostelium subglobosum LB1]|uniref:hypothetical protein n=1 Tax=Acytostelium subglobosum LB1 TaxID=1410327 RepID=UPI000645142F|nr:hypothetical protein SAMD00019534_042430 [Acytostelium subglobosum LB1]GAM21068.1 hypothetical protein SAMD00019534_042430 [Acytostelium subglobosum LB1]|eukprot:XP_012756202.1 hypothetical protein SAMD00019534_042430 [Acytostelium subglobosum LB1]
MSYNFNCANCQQQIWGSTIVNARGDKFHPNCFTCSNCNGQLVNGYIEDKQQPGNYLCVPCQVLVNDQNKRVRQENGFCSKCYNRFNGTEDVIAIDKERYHTNCFKCSSCKRAIVGDIYSREVISSTLSSFCCIDCLETGRVDRCGECRQGILGASSVYAAGQSYHTKCFNCTKCRNNIGLKEYTTENKSPLCTTCNPLLTV